MQTKAARHNMRKAQQPAARKKTVAHMSKNTQSAMGRQSANMSRPGMARAGMNKPGMTKPGMTKPGTRAGRPAASMAKPATRQASMNMAKPATRRAGMSMTKPGMRAGQPATSRNMTKPGTRQAGMSMTTPRAGMAQRGRNSAAPKTRAELYEMARRCDLPGRSRMDRAQLARMLGER